MSALFGSRINLWTLKQPTYWGSIFSSFHLTALSDLIFFFSCCKSNQGFVSDDSSCYSILDIFSVIGVVVCLFCTLLYPDSCWILIATFIIFLTCFFLLGHGSYIFSGNGAHSLGYHVWGIDIYHHTMLHFLIIISAYETIHSHVVSMQILPINIKGLAGSVATLANWLTVWLITMTANLLLNWSGGGLFVLLHLWMLHLCHLNWAEHSTRQ